MNKNTLLHHTNKEMIYISEQVIEIYHNNKCIHKYFKF